MTKYVKVSEFLVHYFTLVLTSVKFYVKQKFVARTKVN
jgi:hypothetical protein